MSTPAATSLKLYLHPLASFCQKALVAFYENDTPFEPQIVNLGDEAERNALKKLWPVGKFPVLRDESRNETVAESTTIIEYLAHHYPGRVALIPADADRARETRFRDRFYDLYVHHPMQKIVTDRLRPEGKHDSYGVEDARTMLQTAYAMIDREMSAKVWAMGDNFTLADCAAAPALFYANMAIPLATANPHAAAYLERLMQRPSFARVVQEAQPYFAMIPK